ncbi:MAG TPA: c-type cytochrome domain-containing protein, partial [Terriglobia bacterium]|nr:c-type cytochrome domain-containing protein [Terriglobia bacterium]
MLTNFTLRATARTILLLIFIFIFLEDEWFMAQDAPALPPSAKGSVDFRRDVEPILHTRCYQCHGPAMQMNGLRFDLKEGALKGGYSGPALVPGKSAQSLLMQRVVSSNEGFKMPPAGPALTSREIGILRGWIDQGAVWPDERLTVTAAQKLSASEKKGHWAFQPIRRSVEAAVR